MADPWEHFSAEKIATATGCPIEAVRTNWPKLVEQMTHCGINDKSTQLAMISNVAHETASRFQPIREFRNADGSIPAHWHSYGGGSNYHGRGFIQLTHRSNYEKYARKVAELWNTELVPEIDFGANPDLALDPDLSAANAACYFRDHGGDGKKLIPVAAARGDWPEVRRLIWGQNPLNFPIGHFGRDAYERIVRIVNALSGPSAPIADYVFPVEGYTGIINLHHGTFPGASDIFAAKGTPVFAVHSGVVVYRAVNDPMGGNAIQISGDDGLQSYYAHGDLAPLVAMGQRVASGTHLFGVGDTGNAASAGPHLHIGIGKTILTGSGPQGGAGSDFDAVGLLRRIQGSVAPVPPPPPTDPRDARIAELEAQVADKDRRLNEVVNLLGYARGDVADAIQSAVNTLKDLVPAP